MEKTCIKCGSQIRDGFAFCTECGAKAPEDVPVQSMEPTPAVPVPPVQQKYAPPQQTVQPVPPVSADKVVSTGAYFGLMLLMALPVIGFIACIIMAFAAKNRNIRNFARAILIWTVIALVLAGILTALFALLANTFVSSFGQAVGEQVGDLGDLSGQLGELEDIVNQFQNSGS